MTTYALVGGDVVDRNGRRRADVVVDQATGRLTDTDAEAADERLDVTGCIVSPGFVDLHVHLRQPGNEAAETIETGSRAAALGGFTAVVAMPNTNPCMDTAAVVSEVLALPRAALFAHFEGNPAVGYAVTRNVSAVVAHSFVVIVSPIAIV